MPRIVVIGKSGQLASELKQLNSDLICLGRNEINLFDPIDVEQKIRALNPSSIINAAAYTAVDNAENDSQSAFNLNSIAAHNLADFCYRFNKQFIHISTDYVFNGEKGTPYKTLDYLSPASIYGKSKAEGEVKVTNTLKNEACIIRASWVYSQFGSNFVKTMLKLLSSKSELSVVSDQIGSPTWAKTLAEVCLIAARHKVSGIQHWSDCGVASWYDFAVAIQEVALEKRILTKKIPIYPITTQEYPTLAKRPPYSVLDKSNNDEILNKINVKHWREQLSLMLDDMLS